jgi:hypothetical protein
MYMSHNGSKGGFMRLFVGHSGSKKGCTRVIVEKIADVCRSH